MAKKDNRINLLPSDLLSSSVYAKFVEIVKTISLVGAVILLLGIFGAGSAIIINANRLNLMATERARLLADMEDLKEQEQSHFIVKDRSDKVLDIKTSAKAIEDELDSLDRLISSYPTEAQISTIQVDSKGLATNSSTPNSRVLTQLINLLVTSGFYNDLVLMSLSLNPQTGYQMETSAVSKPL